MWLAFISAFLLGFDVRVSWSRAEYFLGYWVVLGRWVRVKGSGGANEAVVVHVPCLCCAKREIAEG